MNIRTVLKSCALLAGATLTAVALAQNAGGQRPDPAKQGIEYRKALYTMVGRANGPIGAVLRGGEYNADAVAKGAERLAFLANIAPEVFPEVSKDGDTKALPAIWTDKAGFAKVLKDFQDASTALNTLVKTDHTNSPAFKAAATKVADSCKGCHDNFRAK